MAKAFMWKSTVFQHFTILNLIRRIRFNPLNVSALRCHRAVQNQQGVSGSKNSKPATLSGGVMEGSGHSLVRFRPCKYRKKWGEGWWPGHVNYGKGMTFDVFSAKCHCSFVATQAGS